MPGKSRLCFILEPRADVGRVIFLDFLFTLRGADEGLPTPRAGLSVDSLDGARETRYLALCRTGDAELFSRVLLKPSIPFEVFLSPDSVVMVCD